MAHTCNALSAAVCWFDVVTPQIPRQLFSFPLFIMVTQLAVLQLNKSIYHRLKIHITYLTNFLSCPAHAVWFKTCLIIGSFAFGHHHGIFVVKLTLSPCAFDVDSWPLLITSGMRNKAKPYFPQKSRIFPHFLPLLFCTSVSLLQSCSSLKQAGLT